MAPKQNNPAYVLGVGLTRFIKPRGQRGYPEMGYEAGVKAMSVFFNHTNSVGTVLTN